MIQFLVTAVIVVICLFLLAVMACLMIWGITKLLRFLFPGKFSGAPVKKEKKKHKEVTAERMEDRCLKCVNIGTCPLAMSNVAYPCKFYGDKPISDQEEE